MNCQRFENVVSELARGQMMEADARTEALAHGEKCERCLARLRDEEMLTRGLQLLATEMDSLSAPAEVELKLREAFRSDRVVLPMSVGRARSRYWLVAVAAVLLIAMSAVAMWWRSESPAKSVAQTPPQKQVEKKEQPASVLSKQEEYTVVNELPKRQPQRIVHRNSSPRKAPTQMANHVTNEIATDFISLGYTNPASLQDGGQIIRVNLRRSTLAKFGIPVNMDRYNENVKADVLLGVDGLARAIRFVQ